MVPGTAHRTGLPFFQPCRQKGSPVRPEQGFLPGQALGKAPGGDGQPGAGGLLGVHFFFLPAGFFPGGVPLLIRLLSPGQIGLPLPEGRQLLHCRQHFLHKGFPCLQTADNLLPGLLGLLHSHTGILEGFLRFPEPVTHLGQGLGLLEFLFQPGCPSGLFSRFLPQVRNFLHGGFLFRQSRFRLLSLFLPSGKVLPLLPGCQPDAGQLPPGGKGLLRIL